MFVKRTCFRDDPTFIDEEKLGFITEVYIIFLFSLYNIDCGYSLEPIHSSVYPQSMFYA